LTMWGDLMKFFTGNPSMNVVLDAWNQQRSVGGGNLSMASFSGPAGTMDAARATGNSLPVIVGDPRINSTEEFGQGPTSVESTYGGRTPSQATTKATLLRAAGARLPNGRIKVQQSINIVTKYPTANPSAALRNAELGRRGAVIAWALDSYPDLAASINQNRYSSPAAAAADLDKATRGPFNSYMARLKIEVDLPIRGQPEL
jgi:hypothetical protein